MSGWEPNCRHDPYLRPAARKNASGRFGLLITRYALLALVVCLVCGALGRGAVETYAVFLPTLARAFGWTQVEATSVYAVLHLGAGFASFPLGRVYDRWGPRRTLALGFLACGGGMLLASQATALWHFWFAVGLLGGVGLVALGPIASTALVSRWYGTNLTTSLGMVTAASGFGVLALAPITQLLIDAYGWETTYFVLGVFFLVIPSVLAPLPWSRMVRGRVAAGPDPSPRDTRPISFRTLLRDRAFLALCLMYFLTALGMYSVHPQIVAMLVEAGFSDILAATAFGVAGMANFVGMVTLGIAADRTARLVAVILSYLLSIAGILLLFPLLATASIGLLWAFTIAFGGTMGARGPVFAATAAGIFGRAGSIGTVVGAVLTCGGIGGALGTATGGLLRDLGGNYDWPLAFAAVVLVLPLGIFCIVPELRAGRALASPLPRAAP